MGWGGGRLRGGVGMGVGFGVGLVLGWEWG